MLRIEIYQKSVELAKKDIVSLGITQRQVASAFGMTHSNLNDFLNCRYNKPMQNTVEAVLKAPFWNCETRTWLQALHDYDKNVLSGHPTFPPNLVSAVAAE